MRAAAPGPRWKTTRWNGRTGPTYNPASPKLLVRMRSARSRSRSTSATSRVSSRRNRGDSSSRVPFSAIRQWPPNTTSVVDSWTPQDA